MVEALFCRDHDFRVYYYAGRAALNGDELYTPAIYPDGVGSLFRCSPALALVFSPLSLIPRTPAAGVWTLINIICLTLFFAAGTYLVKRPSSAFWPWLRDRVDASLDGKVDWLILAAVVVTARFWLIDLRCGQVNTFMWALTALALVCDARDKPWPAGILLGVAASSKLIPLFFLSYFVLRRRWKATAATALTVAVLWLAPALVYGWEKNMEYLRGWYETTVVFAQRGRFFYTATVNQSLAAFFYKYCHVFGWDQTRTGLGPHGFEFLARFARAVLTVPLFAAAYVIFRAERRPSGRTGTPVAATLSTLMASYICVVALLVSPVSWDTYFTLTFLPFAAVFTYARTLHSSFLRRAVLGVALTAAALNFLTGDYLGDFGVGGSQYRLVTVGALLLCGTVVALFINEATAFFRRKPAPDES